MISTLLLLKNSLFAPTLAGINDIIASLAKCHQRITWACILVVSTNVASIAPAIEFRLEADQALVTVLANLALLRFHFPSLLFTCTTAHFGDVTGFQIK